ncbi:hypothetical protein ACH5RR_030987 [Cinchona calisaya]|uniref:Pectinesterase inhibitor domain-containing protein n=1 Tax=Cinchona calisaya TaxID=153742 RepID=A0ABD2YHC3_9GENT
MEIINNLNKTNPELIKPLSICGLLYYTVLNADIPEAVDALTKGVPKFAEDAMADSALEAKVCEESFLVYKCSPLVDINAAVCDLSLVAKSIIKNLL